MNAPEFQRVALVTGGAVRVGRAICLGLAEAGYDVVVHHRSSVAEADELVARIRELGRRAALAAGDLREPDVAHSVVDVARSTFGRLDLLVNSAASFRAGPLLESDAADWDEVMALNVRAPHLLVRAAADLLGAVGGSVVNIVDLSAFQPWTLHPVHAVSKAALAHLTRVQARALAPHVRVNAVAPGAVLPPDDYDEEAVGALRRMAPLGRLGSPEDVVRAVLFLADAGYVTGQVLAVDGGRLLGPPGPSAPE
ncbi:MAG: SDR family oxidoreductase [Gemmatimonadetes bacterium]|nr:SDR family oxidoreductase [Gemmatimonadota bacterium]